MPGAGLERQILMPWLGTGIAESLGEIPLVSAPLPPSGPAPIAWTTPGRMHPGRGPGHVFRSSLPGGFIFPSTLVPARGPATAGTLLFDYENGGQITYSWDTDIGMRSRNGTERRIARVACPREIYSFEVILGDGDLAFVQSELVKNAAQGQPFAVALIHESIPIAGSTATTVVPVTSTALLDWAYPGQSVAVLARDRLSMATGVIQSVTLTTITLDVAIGAVAQVGARMMPTIPSYLEDTLGVDLYAVNVGDFRLKARAIYFGNASSSWAPVGATVTSYTDPLTSQVYPVWDRGLDMNGTSPRALMMGIELTDFGGALLMTSAQAFSDFGREIDYTAKSDADRQYVKAFHGATRGRQKSFLLPTWKPDLVAVTPAIASSVLVIHGNATGYGDYAGQYFGSLAQAHLQVLYTNGSIDYVTVSFALDNHDGTESLQLDRSITGTIKMISFLEVCRLDTDAIVVNYQDGTGSVKLPCRVVQS